MSFRKQLMHLYEYGIWNGHLTDNFELQSNKFDFNSIRFQFTSNSIRKCWQQEIVRYVMWLLILCAISPPRAGRNI